MTNAEYWRLRCSITQADRRVQLGAALLKTWRMEQGLTQQQVADRYGTTQGAVSLAEHARIRVPMPLRTVIGLTNTRRGYAADDAAGSD